MFSFTYKYYRNGIELVTNSFLVALRSDTGYYLLLDDEDYYYIKCKIA